MAARISRSRQPDLHQFRTGTRNIIPNLVRKMALEKKSTVTILIDTKHC
ncbi:MAG: hypothetical protein WAV22_07100 [Porticoccaceae bacterium]